jgi:predicted nucleic acid-binding protein
MLEEIPARSRFFIDSNIFIYHFLDLSEGCSNLLERAERKEIRACTSTVVLGEVLHRLMLSEAVEKYRIKPHQAIRYLKEHPESIISLEKCEMAVEEIPEFNVEILSMGGDAVFESRGLRKQYGLMTNDSLNLYSMNSRGLKIIATNDSDFDRIKGIEVWTPGLIR